MGASVSHCPGDILIQIQPHNFVAITLAFTRRVCPDSRRAYPRTVIHILRTTSAFRRVPVPSRNIHVQGQRPPLSRLNFPIAPRPLLMLPPAAAAAAAVSVTNQTSEPISGRRAGRRRDRLHARHLLAH